MRLNLFAGVPVLLSLVFLSLVAVGCTPANFVLPAARTPISATAESATIVFMHASQMSGAPSATSIFDENQHLVAEIFPRQYRMIQVPPGEHTFLGVTRGRRDTFNRHGLHFQDMVRATVEPGKVYFVLVAPNFRSIRFDAFTSRHENWSRLGEFLTSCSPVDVDMARATPFWQERARHIASIFEQAGRYWLELDEERRTARTLLTTDGIVQGDQTAP